MKKSALRGQMSLIAIVVVVTLVLAGVVGLLLRGGSASGERQQADYFAVKRGSFDITIPVTGELAALKQIEIRNNLDGRAIITEIIPEGVFVNAGDVVLRLNDEDIRNRLREAQDRVNVAEAALIAAQAKLDIQIKTREAELAKADLAIKLADLALKSWEEGQVVSKRQELSLALETAQKEYDRLKDRFVESEALVAKEFISRDEYRRDEIAMIKAESDLKQAKLNLDVYEKYEYEQERAQTVSDLDQSKSERERIEQQNDAEVRSAQSDVDSKKYQLDSAKEKLAELQQQLVYCTVTAPAPGLVVYYASTQQGGGRNEGRPPMVGTELSRNEMVIILPDTSQMVAAVKISEALVGQINRGQRATVTCDAMPEQALTGTVLSVGVLAESGGWRDPNRRDYTVRILLDAGTELGLKPSMRCKASIFVGRVNDALHVPIQAVSRRRSLSYVYVPQGQGYAQHKVSTGNSSELYIEIAEGLTEGQIVLLRQPQPEEIVSTLPIPKSAVDQRPEDLPDQLSGLPMDNGTSSEDGQPRRQRPGGARPPGGGGGSQQGDSASSDGASPERGRGNNRPRDSATREEGSSDSSAQAKPDAEPQGEKPAATPAATESQ